MIDFRGYFITKKSVEDVRQELSNILNMNRNGGGIREEKIYYKRYCEMTMRMLENCLESGMYGVEKWKRKLKYYKDSDDVNELFKGKRVSDDIILELGLMLNSVILLKDLPSCKTVLDCSKDVALACVKDMANNNFLRIGVGLVSLLSKGKDTITVVDVWHFYNNIVNELDREVREEAWIMSPIEQALYSRAKAERAFCYKAMLKTDFGIAAELKEIIDEVTADKDIREYENAIKINDNSSFVISNQK